MTVHAEIARRELRFEMQMHGIHWAQNALGVLACIDALGLSVDDAAARLASCPTPKGRGGRLSGRYQDCKVTLIDDSYNASPASMVAAFDSMTATAPTIMILSEMRELGDATATEHAALMPHINGLSPRLVIALGSAMHDALGGLDDAIATIAAPRYKSCGAEFSKMPLKMVTSSLSKDHLGRGHGAFAMPFVPVSKPHHHPKHHHKMEGTAMLPDLLVPLSDHFQPFNLFRYITFRTGGATITALLIALICGPAFIRWLKTHQTAGQPIRDDGPQSHLLTKIGTPTMGGLLILIAFAISTLLWMPLSNPYLWPVLLISLSFGAIGCLDDWMKLRKRSHNGMSARMKMLLQLVIAFFTTLIFIELSPEQLRYGVAVPFFKDTLFAMGIFYVPFAMMVIVGASNAVNLTDGLDGLAIVPVMIVAGCFALIAYLAGNYNFATYLQINFVPGTGDLAVMCGALIGAGLGFLWFNAPPARVFMGDTGSLALGGTLGAIAVATRHELVLAITGGLFVVETLSVILQVASFKLTGKRIFLMAPLHHHFEKKGWAEPTIVIRFWIIAVVLAVAGLSSLKLR